MKVEVKTDEYELANGKKPSGDGYWAFFMGSSFDDIENAHWFSGVYEEAKKKGSKESQKIRIYLYYCWTIKKSPGVFSVLFSIIDFLQ